MVARRLLVPILAIGALSPSALAAAEAPAYPAAPPSSIDSPLYSPTRMTTGHVEFRLGVQGGDPGTSGVFQGFGRANVPLGGGMWNLQLETGGSALFDDGDSASSFEGIGHIWSGLPWGAAGIFGGGTVQEGDGIGTVGVEGETYLGNVTLGAQGSYNLIDSGNLWQLRGYGDYYVSPDLRIGGDVQYWTGEGNDLWQLSADLEKRFTGTPVSGWASVGYADKSGGDVWTAMFGGRVFVDKPRSTLKEHDRNVPFDFVIPFLD